ncbi:MAG: hypothetical protein JW706_03860 [Opitutales bacterium]|nr:hypothetical protein [Opitutales bacterium]
MNDPKRQMTVYEAVWNWRVTAKPVVPPEPHALRKLALVPICVLLLVFCVLRFGFGSHHGSLIALGFLGIFVLVTLFRPQWLPVIQRVAMRFGVWVGIALTWILLVPFYYIVFIPLRLLFMAKGKDLMFRTYDPSATSYWVGRDVKLDRKHFERQF